MITPRPRLMRKVLKRLLELYPPISTASCSWLTDSKLRRDKLFTLTMINYLEQLPK